jgi:hypothetical protein
MKHYKYLIMQTDFSGESSKFLSVGLGGSGRCCASDTNVTHFSKHDFGGGHQNDEYWNDPESLLVGFSCWYLRTPEKTAYNMSNRIYHSTYSYRFFRVEEDMDNEEDMTAANMDLASYEITEDIFISDIKGSWAFQQVNNMFSVKPYSRPEQNGVRVTLVYNGAKDTWCWISDYLNKDDCKDFDVQEITLPVNITPPDATKYITLHLNCEYRFGGNDAYNKRKALEE